MPLIYCFKTPALTDDKKNSLLSFVRRNISEYVADIETEYCFYIESKEALSADETGLLRWLLSETFEPEKFSEKSFLTENSELRTQNFFLEVGPRMNFTTAWSTNAVSVCHACGLTKVTRIEKSRRYKLVTSAEARKRASEEKPSKLSSLQASELSAFLALVHDRMTECPYPEPLTTFETGVKPEVVFDIPFIEEGKSALEKINTRMGLGLDDWDIDYYYNLFVKDIGRFGYDVKTKPVKIMRLSIDVSSVPPNSPNILKEFIRKPLLQKLTIETIEFLNNQLKQLNNQGVKSVEDLKCNFDVEIGRDMLIDYDKNNIDNFILWSGDSDFADPVRQLLKDDKRVTLFATARRVSSELSELVEGGLFIFDIQKIKDFICWKKEITK